MAGLIKMRADAVGRDRIQQQRVAVRVRFGDGCGGGGAAGAAAIADDDRLSERIGKLRSDDPRDEIGRAAGRNGDDELNRTARIIGLRARRTRRSKTSAAIASKRLSTLFICRPPARSNSTVRSTRRCNALKSVVHADQAL